MNADASTPSGRTALITGGAGGLGLAVARRLAGLGCRVALLGRTRSALEAAAAQLGAGTIAIRADVTSREDVERALEAVGERLGAPTWLVQTAGLARSSAPVPPDDDLWRETLDVNVTGPWIVATAALPAMLAAGGGAIVNVASTAALRGFRYTAAYVASKHALLGLTRALAEDLAGRGVRVNAVCPGFLDTPMTAHTIRTIVEATGRSPEEVRATLGAMNARGDLVPPDEVASVVLDLLQDERRTGDAPVIE